MNETIVVGCRYCGWLTYRDRTKLERSRYVVCESCRSLLDLAEAEAAGKDIVMRRWPALNLLHSASTMTRR